jgi:hypothetical protein
MRHANTPSLLAAAAVLTLGTAWAQPPGAEETPDENERQEIPETREPYVAPRPCEPCPYPQRVQPCPYPAPRYAARRHRRHEHRDVFSPYQVALTAGAGVANYFGSTMHNADPEPGAMWDARLTIGTRSWIAVELAYVGSTNRVMGAISDGHIVSNGVDGDLRLQLPYRVQPYIFGGVGYNHMTLDNESGDPLLHDLFYSSDNQVSFPAGGGVAGYFWRHGTVDVRASYRALLANDFVRFNPEREGIHQWSVTGRIGYAF